MAWTELTRRQHAREGDRYASDLTDTEGALIKLIVPRLRRTGHPRTTYLRDVFDAILYVATTGLDPLTFRSPNSFMQPFVQRPRGFFHPVRSVAVLDYRTR